LLLCRKFEERQARRQLSVSTDSPSSEPTRVFLGQLRGVGKNKTEAPHLRIAHDTAPALATAANRLFLFQSLVQYFIIIGAQLQQSKTPQISTTTKPFQVYTSAQNVVTPHREHTKPAPLPTQDNAENVSNPKQWPKEGVRVCVCILYLHCLDSPHQFT
jgi:hypothetical protein